MAGKLTLWSFLLFSFLLVTNAGLLAQSASFTNYNTSNSSIPSNYLFDVDYDGGFVYAATNGAGLGILDVGANTWTSVTTTTSGFPGNIVTSVIADGATIYVGTQTGGLGVYDGSWTTYTTADGLGGNQISDLLLDGSDLWISHNAGVSKWNGASFTNHSIASIGAGTVMNDLAKFDGDIYVGTNYGLAKYDGSWTVYNFLDPHLGNNVYSLAADDANDILFVGNYHRGLYTFNGSSFTFINNTAEETINNLYYDGSFLFIGMWSTGLYVKEGATYTLFNETDGLAGNSVFATDKGGGYHWVATHLGLSKMEYTPISITHTIDASAGANGEIDPDGAVSVADGDDQLFTFTPDAGYRVVEILVDGSPVTLAGSYEFLNVTADHTIEVSFNNDNYYYVDGTTGDNANTGFTADQAWATLTYALANTATGDVIFVAEGTYTEDLTIGTAGISLVGPNSGVSGCGVRGSEAELVGYIKVTSDDFSFDGFQVTDGKEVLAGEKAGIHIVENTSGHSITNNLFSRTPTADFFFGVINEIGGVTDLILSGNKFTGWNVGLFLQNAEAVVNNNCFEENEYGAAILGAVDVTVTGNNFDSNGEGLEVLSSSSLMIDKNRFEDNGTGILLYAGGGIQISSNTIKGSATAGISVQADLSSFGALDEPIVISNNSIYDNTIGLDASAAIGSSVAYYILDAKDNWWGSVNGPEDNTFKTSASELPANSADPVEQWVNQLPAGELGNEIKDNDDGGGGDALWVEYYPWDLGTPVLSLEDISSTTGASVSMDLNLNGKGLSMNTFQGTFTYDDTKLDFTGASYGSGTLVNGSNWSIFFTENVSGTVTFAGVGFTPISSDGVLFSLNFTIIDGVAGSADVTGENEDFKADGSQVFGTAGDFTGTITYTHIQATYLRGDVTLDGMVDLDDALLLQDRVTNATVGSFSNLAKQNADADLSSGDPENVVPDNSDITLGDVIAVLQYVLTGTWPAPAPPPAGAIVFNNVNIDENNLVNIPVSIKNGSNIQTLELIVNYDESIITYQSFSQLMLGSGNFVSSAKISDGVASFMYATISLQSGNITPGKIILNLGSSIPSYFHISSSYRLNGGDVTEGPSYTHGVTNVEENLIPEKFEVAQNFPNPFNPTTTIKFGLPEASQVTVKIFNMIGQEVKTLVNEFKNAGTYSVTWNGDNESGKKITSGVYIYRVTAGNNVQTMKMILMK